MVALTNRSRLFRRFRPIVDGLLDLARSRAEEVSQPEPSLTAGQWQRSHRMSYDLEVVERMAGSPLHILARALDSVHRREIVNVALVAIDTDGVIHSAWSDGDTETLGKAAGFLAQDLERAANS